MANIDNLERMKSALRTVIESRETGTRLEADTPITQNITYYARWIINSYTVTYDGNGSTSQSKTSESVYYNHSVPSIPTATKTGYGLLGWYSENGDKLELTTKIIGDITYTASWQKAVYNITYDYQGKGTANTSYELPQTFTIEDEVTFTYQAGGVSYPINPTANSGYTFTGWNPTKIARGTANDVTVKAEFSANVYSIAYDLNGHSEVTNPNTKTSYTYGSTFTPQNLADADAIVVFKGWNPASITSTTIGSIIFTAQWATKTFKVTWNGNGGTPSRTYDEVETGKKLTSTPSATRLGYTFDDWFNQATSGTKLDITTAIITSDVTYYAHWNPISYTITYNMSGHGTNPSSNPTSYTIETSTITLSNPANLDDYTFACWQDENENQITTIPKGSTGNKNIIAKWYSQVDITFDNNQVTITWNSNGGSAVASQTLYVGDSISAFPTTPTKTGYTLAGWYTAATGGSSLTVPIAVSDNVTYYAHWTGSTYTVTLSQEGGTGGTSSVTATYDAAMPIITVSTKTGYTFGGYYTGTSGAGTQYYTSTGASARTWNLAKSTTLYANWTANTYTVKYNGNTNTGGSTASSTHTYDVSQNLTANGFTKTGYAFDGWATTSSGTALYTNSQSVKNLASTQGATFNLYAKWNPITYTVAYNGNTNTGGSTASSTHTYGVAKNLTANGFTKTGNTFAGWAKTSGGYVVYANSASVKNLASTQDATVTLYAKWTPNTYNLTLDWQGGSNGTASATVTYGAAMPSITLPTRTGYTFSGYYGQKSGAGDLYYKSNGSSARSWTMASDGTVYAYWAANTYTVKLDHQGGSGVASSVTATYGSAMPSITKPTRTGYTFGGYYTGTSGSGTQYYTASAASARAWDLANSTTTLYAKWAANTYTATCYRNDGTTTAQTVSGVYDGYYTLPTPAARTDYTFGGWYKEAACINFVANAGGTVKVAGNVNYYAKWTEDAIYLIDDTTSQNKIVTESGDYITIEK